MKKTIIKQRKYKGFVRRDEIWYYDDDHPVKMYGQYYNKEGEWIGDKFVAMKLIHLGIYPQKAKPDHCVCSIGFNKQTNEWYGWSHRAICGFRIGDMLFDPNWTGGLSEDELEKMPYTKRGSIKIETMDQAEQAARNFAEDVS